jgi:ribosome-binding factor A
VYKESLRSQRVADVVFRKLASLFQHKITDQRLQQVYISFVDVSPDLKNARVYYSVFKNQVISDDVEKGLIKAAHFLRKELARESVIRTVPKLNFVFDKTLQRAQRLDDLLTEEVSNS